MKALKTNLVYVFITVFSLICFSSHGQFLDCSTGLLQMPSAELYPSGTFMITNCLLNKHTIPENYWGYNTFGYGFDITFLSRLEVYYTCILFDGKKKANPSERDLIMFNQDRHIGAKVLLTKEGDFGIRWLPNIVLGANDIDSDMFGERHGNGFFTRIYAVASKRFYPRIGEIGFHIGYQFNKWTVYPLYGPMAAIDWCPIWLQKEEVVKTKLIAEYDAHTFNVGAIVSLWKDHIEAMLELQALKYVSAGIRFKTVLKS